MSDILQAARSYYGLADTDVRKTDIYTNEAGQPMLVFELALSAEDFIAIGARMKNMQQTDTQPDTAIIEGPTVEAMREAYNALSKAEKGRYGSFARYMQDTSAGIVGVDTREPYRNTDIKRQVVHVDAPEEPEPVSMDGMWLAHEYVSQAQWNHASDYSADGKCFVQWAMLTDEQKQKAKEKS